MAFAELERYRAGGYGGGLERSKHYPSTAYGGHEPSGRGNVASRDVYGGYVDNSGFYHGPSEGTVSAGGGWVWQSGGGDSRGYQTDGTYANGMWVPNPDAPAGMCGKGPKPAPGVSEEAIWKDILEDWVESHPNDPVASWILYQGTRQARRGSLGAMSSVSPEPSWIRELGLGITGEPTQKVTGHEWVAGEWEPQPVYEEEPGATIGLRPLGGQASLTADQMEQLMYYYGWLETGQPSTAKGWMQAAAYSMPNKWSDYLALSESMIPKVSPPKARTTIPWQR